mgnify:CR=1 FL=1
MEIINIENLYKAFDGVEVLKDVNLSFESGTVTTIIGPSGSGKSTLLRCLNQLENVTSGTILFNGEDITSSKVNLNNIRSKIGMVFQSFNLFNNLTVLENCTIGQIKVLDRTKENANNVATDFLQKVGMYDYKDRKVTTLSGGQKQRVAIARTLSMNPEIILFDEPTSSLDPEMVNDVLEVMKNIISKDYTFIVVTHEMEFAKDVSDRIIFMEEGQIVNDGIPSEIWNSTSSDRLKKFLNI